MQPCSMFCWLRAREHRKPAGSRCDRAEVTASFALRPEAPDTEVCDSAVLHPYASLAWFPFRRRESKTMHGNLCRAHSVCRVCNGVVLFLEKLPSIARQMFSIRLRISIRSRKPESQKARSDERAFSCWYGTQDLYFTAHPYGLLVLTLTVLPAASSPRTCGTYCVALLMSAGSALGMLSMAPL